MSSKQRHVGHTLYHIYSKLTGAELLLETPMQIGFRLGIALALSRQADP
jgi:hypothetical protein